MWPRSAPAQTHLCAPGRHLALDVQLAVELFLLEERATNAKNLHTGQNDRTKKSDWIFTLRPRDFHVSRTQDRVCPPSSATHDNLSSACAPANKHSTLPVDGMRKAVNWLRHVKMHVSIAP